MEDAMPPLYRCSKCDSYKEFGEFPPSKAHHKGQWCRQCLREDQRRIKGLAAVERSQVCLCCGVTFSTTYVKAAFCSRQCKSNHRNALAAAERLAAKPDRACVHCGGAMPKAMRADAKFCSEACNSAAHAITRKMAKRVGRAKSPDDPLLERNHIAKRDGYRCGICGGKVDMTKKHPDPMFGSIDHIVPLSRGGSNELANLQLAHLKCNVRKQASAMNEQLRLIG